jgi:tetratricopeptide (TPR) repeat protein
LRQAEDFFKRAWDADHNFLVAARNLANCYSIQGDPDRAIQICNQALHIVGENRTQYLLTQQIHAWIHNSRGWAYLRMVIEFRKKRLSNPLQVADCKSWLLMAQQNFEEAIRLIRKSQGDGKGQESIPMINQLFVVWEKQLLENGFLEDDVLASLHSTLEEMPRGDHFTMIYHSLLSPSSDKFSGIFRHFWMNHSFVPSEYLGLIADVQLLKEYLGVRFAVAPLAEQIILQNTHKNLDEGLEVIHANLPSCFLGLHYLWSGHPERAVKCWRKRLQNLRQVSDYAKFQSLNDLATTSIDVTPAALNHELWMYLYAGLSAMFRVKAITTYPADPCH